MQKIVCDECREEIVFPPEKPVQLDGDSVQVGNRKYAVYVSFSRWDEYYGHSPDDEVDLCEGCRNTTLIKAFTNHKDYVVRYQK